MHCVWLFHSAGPLNIVLQSMQVKDDLHIMPCLSSLGFLTTSEHATDDKDKKSQCYTPHNFEVNRSPRTITSKIFRWTSEGVEYMNVILMLTQMRPSWVLLEGIQSLKGLEQPKGSWRLTNYKENLRTCRVSAEGRRQRFF